MRADTLPCSIPNCPNLQRARGWCSTHWSRWQRFGDPLRERPTDSERFWARVDGGDVTTCWTWQGAVGSRGYGVLGVGGRQSLAHRFAFEDVVGPIPQGLTLDHLCRVRTCVNPWHLDPVPRGVNTLRGETLSAANSRKTHCVQGHPFDESNTYVRQNRRHCRACARDRARARYYRDAA